MDFANIFVISSTAPTEQKLREVSFALATKFKNAIFFFEEDLCVALEWHHVIRDHVIVVRNTLEFHSTESPNADCVEIAQLILYLLYAFPGTRIGYSSSLNLENIFVFERTADVLEMLREYYELAPVYEPRETSCGRCHRKFRVDGICIACGNFDGDQHDNP